MTMSPTDKAFNYGSACYLQGQYLFAPDLVTTYVISAITLLLATLFLVPI